VGRKAVFLDVDGTFVDDRGVIPPSARAAVVAARANGHRLFLCTGRSMSQLGDEILEPGFDGAIASAGGHVEYQGEVLPHRARQRLRELIFGGVTDVEHGLDPVDLHQLVLGAVAVEQDPHVALEEPDQVPAGPAVVPLGQGQGRLVVEMVTSGSMPCRASSSNTAS
jgi:hypothetical protein